MEMKVFVILVICCVGAVSSSDDVQERQKRNIWKWLNFPVTLITGFVKDIATFTEDQFNKFKESLKTLSEGQLEKIYDVMKDYYGKLDDKSSAEALRIKQTIAELKKDIYASGSSTTRLSLLAAVVFVLISIFAIR